MSVEHSPSKEQLIGKSVEELICLLPTFSWYYTDSLRNKVKQEISEIIIVDYDTYKPRKDGELFGHIPVRQGTSITKEKLTSYLSPKTGRTTGLISLVGLKEYSRELEGQQAYLPLIDMDLDIPASSLNQTLSQIKKEIKTKTEINKGVILASGNKNHLHFIGTERLLSKEQFVTFISLCLTMSDSNGNILVDPRWAAHALSPMKYFMEVDKGEINWSAYDLTARFATLRIATSERKPNLPKVIDVL